GLDLEGEMTIRAVNARAGFAGYQFGIGADGDKAPAATQQPLKDLPETDDKGHAKFSIAVDKLPETTQPLEARVVVRMADAGGRAIEGKLTLPVRAPAPMMGVKPLFSGRSLGEGDTAGFDVIVVSPDGKALARNKLHYELVRIDTRYQWYRQDGSWQYEPIKTTKRITDGDLDVAPDPPR